MKLTGKCKEDFEKWYNENNPYKFLSDLRGSFLGNIERKGFYSIDYNMQYGVYVDFFDTVKMQIYIKPTTDFKWSVYIDNFGKHILTDYLFTNTRHQARQEAIIMANKIYNEIKHNTTRTHR